MLSMLFNSKNLMLSLLFVVSGSCSAADMDDEPQAKCSLSYVLGRLNDCYKTIWGPKQTNIADPKYGKKREEFLNKWNSKKYDEMRAENPLRQLHPQKYTSQEISAATMLTLQKKK